MSQGEHDEGREPSSAAKHEPSARLGCAILLLFVVLIGGTIAAVVLTLRAGGDTVLRLAVTDTPISATIHLDARRDVTFWTEIDVTHRGISPRTSNDDLPHVVDYVVTVTSQGATIAEQHCNPFDSNFAKWTGTRSSMGEDSGRSYDGRINGCGLALEPGDYVITVRREWLAHDPRITLHKSDLLLRAK